MPQSGLTIGQLAGRTHTSVPTIRYYEEIGLLPDAQRGANGHRRYADADVTRLGFIKRCRDFGFPIEQVRAMVRLFEDGDGPCAEVRDLADAQLQLVQARFAQLRQLEGRLAAFVAGCHTNCCAGKTRDCNIIGDLSAANSRDTGGDFREIRRP